MASRYTNNPIKKINSGEEVFRTKVYPKIPLRDNDIYIVTQTGDRLDGLATQFYNDASLWWIIAAANNIHDAPLGLKDGIVLRVPFNYNEVISNYNK